MISKNNCIRRALGITVGVTAVVLLLAGGVGAATLTVDDSGGKMFTRIQDAINNASAGDIILVYSGTYHEKVNVNKQLTLRGIDTDGGKPVVNGVTLSAGWSTLDGFATVNSGILVNSSNNIIKNNTASSSLTGIEIISSSNNTLTDNIASSNINHGFNLEFSNSNILTNNTVNSNTDGIDLYSSSGNTLTNNTVTSNNYIGIYLYSSSTDSTSNNTLINNCMTGNRYNFYMGEYVDYLSNNIDISNTVDGRPIYYVKNGTNIIYGISSNAGTFYCILCSNVTIKDLTLTKNGYGVFLWKTNNSKIENINASLNVFGIYLSSSSRNNLINNTASGMNSHGIVLSSSSNNNLISNTASSNYYDGVLVLSSSSNILTNNTISLNRWEGISVSSSIENKIYNNFFNNPNNFLFGVGIYGNSWNTTKTSSTNIIGNSYLGGNFWANPNGTGFSERCTDANNDGICDSPYVLDSINIDQLPLTSKTTKNYISYCTTISSPGEYVLSNSIINSDNSTCINITSSNVVLDGNGYTIGGVDSSKTYGVYVYNSTMALTNVAVKNLNVTDWGYGIFYNNTENGSIINSTASSNNGTGINLEYSSNITLTNNTASSNTIGISLYYSTNNTLTYNNMADNGYNFDMFGYRDSHFYNSIDISNTVDKKPVFYIKSGANTIYDNSSNAGTFFCIWCYNVTIKNLTLTQNGWGVFFWKTNISKIENINASSDIDGIYLWSSVGNTLADNIVNLNNNQGISLYFSDDNTLTNNTANLNKYSGIGIGSANNNTLYNNIANSNRNHGIALYYSGNNTFTKNTLSFNNGQGILIYNLSNYNKVLNNTATFNGQDGINPQYSMQNIIRDNNASSNGFHGIESTESNNSLISGNILNINKRSGMQINGGTGNIMENNTANSNNQYGISIWSSGNNTIYNNHFNNTNNFQSGGMIYSNYWNTTKTPGTNIVNGSYHGGNFWANPNGTGFSETCIDADNDGICDSPYVLDTNNVDYLPLAPSESATVNLATIPVNEKFDFSSGIIDNTNGDFYYENFGSGMATTPVSPLKVSGNYGGSITDFLNYTSHQTFLPPASEWWDSETVYMFDGSFDMRGIGTRWIETKEGKFACLFIQAADKYSITFKWVYPYGGFGNSTAPSPTPTPATTPTGGKGDVNGDGQVTVVDALFVAQYTVGIRTLSSSQLTAADVNGDGQVNIVDALFIAQYTVGLRQL